MTGDNQHNNRTDDSCGNYRQQFGFNQIEIKHQSHSRRHKKESEIVKQKFTYLADTLQLNPFQFQSGSQQQHSDYARRQFYAGDIDSEFAKCQKTENYQKLFKHDFVFFKKPHKSTQKSRA